MNERVLKEAEGKFLRQYPGGFNHPSMLALGKKHKMDSLEKFAKESFSKEAFKEPLELMDNVVRMFSRSTMTSLFEKPKFRDMVKALSKREKEAMAEIYFQLLHGKKQEGFEALVEKLEGFKLAKWTAVSVVPAYYRPQVEVFVKPTTAKLIVEKLELGLDYQAKPYWEFYLGFKEAINEAKKITDKSLALNNPAYCGFLMMTLS